MTTQHRIGLRIRFTTLVLAAVVAACSDAEGSAFNGYDEAEEDAGTDAPYAPQSDTTPPSVVSLDLGVAGARSGVRKDANIVITFSEPMDRASVLTAYQAPRIPIDDASFSWDGAGTVLTVNPPGDLQYGESSNREHYAVRITTLAKDLAGNALAAEYPVEFTTLTRQTSYLGLTPDAAIVVDSAGKRYSCSEQVPILGDSNLNTYSKLFLTFDLGELPEDIAGFDSAHLSVEWSRVVGDPLMHLGQLMLEHTSVALPIQASAISAPALQALGAFSNTAYDNVEIDITDAIGDDYTNRTERAKRSQYRLTFARTTDNGSDADVLFMPCDGRYMRLTASYLVP